MRFFITNPHNGAPIDAHGIQLEPGYEVEVTEADSVLLKKTYEFLMQRSDDGKSGVAKAKAKKLKGEVHWGEQFVPAEEKHNDSQERVIAHGAPEDTKAPEPVAPVAVAPKPRRKSLLGRAKDAILGTDTKAPE